MAINIDKKKIAKNTLVNYLQVMISTIIGIIISRIVLQCLGASDYGLYNVVGGTVAMFAFISSSMSSTTTRFLNFEMGKHDGNLNRVFNISNILHIVTALVVFLCVESVGIYYIENYLNVACGKETDAMFVFQISTFVTCIGITNVPYRAVLVAYEKFSLIAFVEIFNTFLKLLLVILLIYYKGNALRFYAIAMCAGTAISFIAYHYICKQKWPEVIKWRPILKLNAYKEQLGFNNWNFTVSAASMCMTEGSHILINIFFGTVANAAYAISKTVQGYVRVLSRNFSKTVSPQITQMIGMGEIKKATDLAANISRFYLLLMEVVSFTLFVELDFILHLWLGSNIPLGTLEFCQWTLVFSVVASTNSGIYTMILGFGRLKWFAIQNSFWYYICIPLGYWLFWLGYPSYSIMILFVLAELINRVFQFVLLHNMFSFNILSFVNKAWKRPILVALLLISYMLIYRMYWEGSMWYKAIGIVQTATLSILLSITIGLLPKEKAALFQQFRVIKKEW